MHRFVGEEHQQRQVSRSSGGLGILASVAFGDLGSLNGPTDHALVGVLHQQAHATLKPTNVTHHIELKNSKVNVPCKSITNKQVFAAMSDLYLTIANTDIVGSDNEEIRNLLHPEIPS